MLEIRDSMWPWIKTTKRSLLYLVPGLKLIYGDKIGDYVGEAMCWNIEEYASVNPPAIPKDARH